MTTQVSNKEIANILFNIAELLEIDDANRFRVNAYKNAARMIMNMDEPLATLSERGLDLVSLPTIGRDISASIDEILRTGTLSLLQEIELSMPPQIVELSHIPGIGAKRIKILEHYFPSLLGNQLYQAACKGNLIEIPGIGSKTQEAIKLNFQK